MCCGKGGSHKVKDVSAIPESAVHEDRIYMNRNISVYRTYRFQATCVKCNERILAESLKEFEGFYA